MGSYFAMLLLFFLSHGAEDRKGLREAFLQAESRFAEEQQEQQQEQQQQESSCFQLLGLVTAMVSLTHFQSDMP